MQKKININNARLWFRNLKLEKHLGEFVKQFWVAINAYIFIRPKPKLYSHFVRGALIFTWNLEGSSWLEAFSLLVTRYYTSEYSLKKTLQM